MPQRMSVVYRVSVSENKARLAELLACNELAYNTLKNKDSEYARAIKALGDLHLAAYKIYKDAPSEI